MKVDETVIELDTAHNVHENLVKIDRWRVFHPDWAVYVTRGSTIYEKCFKKEAKLSALASSVKNDDENPMKFRKEEIQGFSILLRINKLDYNLG